MPGTGSAEDWLRSSKKESGQPLSCGAPLGPGSAITPCFTIACGWSGDHTQRLGQPRTRLRGRLGDGMIGASRAVRGPAQNWVRFYQSKLCRAARSPGSGANIRFLFAAYSKQRWLARVLQQASGVLSCKFVEFVGHVPVTAPLRSRLRTGVVLRAGAGVFIEAVPPTCGSNQNHDHPVPSRERKRAVARLSHILLNELTTHDTGALARKAGS